MMSLKTFRTLVNACACIYDANVAQKLNLWCYFWDVLPLATVFGSKRHFQGYSSQCDTYGWPFCQKETRVSLLNANQFLFVIFIISLKTVRTLVNACAYIHDANVAKKLKNECFFGVSYHWLLFLALKGISKATVLDVTPMAGHFAKKKLTYVFLITTNSCL